MEEYFPRGGTAKGSSHNSQSKVIGKKRKQTNLKEKLKSSRKKFKKDSTFSVEEIESDDKLNILSEKRLVVDKRHFNLYYKDLTHGLTTLCAVKEILKDKIVVCLPGHMKANLPIIDVSKPLKRVSEEDWHSIDLKKLFKIGQILSCKVLQMKKENKFYRTIVTTDPGQVNSKLFYPAIQRGRIMQMAINGIEDHGYSLCSGIPSLTAFLPFEKAEHLHKLHSVEKLSVGMILWTKVYKSTISELSNIVHCTAEPVPISKPLMDDQIPPELLPGTTVKVVINETNSSGAIVQVNASELTGGIPWPHLRTFLRDSGLKKPKVGDCLAATVLYRYPLTDNYFFTHSAHSLVDPPTYKSRNGELFKKCKVIKWTFGGIYVALPLPPDEEAAECFMSYASLGRPDRNTFENDFKEGTEIDCLVNGIDFLTGMYFGGVKPEGSIMKRSDLKVGSLVKVTIKKYNDKGLVVSVNSQVDGFVVWNHATDSTSLLDSAAINILKLKFPLQTTHLARVCRAEQSCLWLSLKPSLVSNPSPTDITDFKVGECYNVRVKHDNAKFINVLVNEIFNGCIEKKYIKETPPRNSIIQCYVKKVHPKQIYFSMSPCTDDADPQIGDLVDVTIKSRKNKIYVISVNDLDGIVNDCHLEPDNKKLKIGSVHKAKILKITNNSNVEVTMRKDLLTGNIPTSVAECHLGSVVSGLVTLVDISFSKISFAGNCQGVIYYSKAKFPAKLHDVVTVKVIDKETNYLILDTVTTNICPFKVGEKYSLTVDNVTPAGLFASFNLSDGSSKDVFIPKNQLDDFEEISKEKMEAIKQGDIIPDAVIMCVDGGAPIFTLKKSISSYLEAHEVLGKSYFLFYYSKAPKDKEVIYLPCTIKQIFGSAVFINAPVQNVSVLQVTTSSIEVDALKVHQTVICCIHSYDKVTDTLNLELSPKLPEDVLLEWADKRTKEYVEWIRETFSFGSLAEFYTESNDRTGKVTQDGYTSSGFMLGQQKIQKFQKISVMVVHREKQNNEFVSYVIPTKKCLIEKKASASDYEVNFAKQEVSVNVLHQTQSLELAVIKTPENLKGYLVYLPLRLANQVRPAISDQLISEMHSQKVKILGIGGCFYIGVKLETLEINKNAIKMEIKQSQSEENVPEVAVKTKKKRKKKAETSTDVIINEEITDEAPKEMSNEEAEKLEGIKTSKIRKLSEGDISNQSKIKEEMKDETPENMSNDEAEKCVGIKTSKTRKLSEGDISNQSNKKPKQMLEERVTLGLRMNYYEDIGEPVVMSNVKHDIQEDPNSGAQNIPVPGSKERMLKNCNTGEFVPWSKVPEEARKELLEIEELERQINQSDKWAPVSKETDKTKSILGLFKPSKNKLAQDNQHSESEDDDDDDKGKKRKKKSSKSERKRRQEEKERLLREKEEELLHAMDNPQSADHFERLAMARPTDSKMWIQYMAFQLQAVEIDKARAIGKRALSLIPAQEEQDRLNVWIALLNLEHLYGSKEQFRETFSEALRSNDDFKVNMKVLDLYVESKNKVDLEHHVNNMVKKYKTQLEAWHSCLSALMEAGMEENARQLLQRALKSLLQKEHISLISRFALLENKAGHEEEAQTLLDNVLTSYPQRTDVWSVYTDMLIKSQRYDLARQVFVRAHNTKLPAKKMKTIFSKWLAFELAHGSSKTVEDVKKAAANYVNLKMPAE